MALVYETLLCAPGMAENVKLDMRVSRRTLLLLAAAVENQLSGKPGLADSVFGYFGKDTIEELERMISECLVKSELTELHGKLKAFDGL